MTAEPREGLRDTTPYMSPQLEGSERFLEGVRAA